MQTCGPSDAGSVGSISGSAGDEVRLGYLGEAVRKKFDASWKMKVIQARILPLGYT